MRRPYQARAWTAEIEWGRSDGRPGFRACARHELDASPVVLAESPALDWPPSGPDSVAALTSAVRTLEASLLEAGWRPLGLGGAWYAKRFAWEAEAAPDAEPRSLWAVPSAPEQSDGPQPSRSAGPFARTPPWPEGARELWRCEIAWDAGWSESSFEAVVYRPNGRRGRAIGASSPAKHLLMGQPDGSEPEIQQAIEHLAGALVAAGWSPAGRGLNWYSQRFVWRRAGAPPDSVRPAAPGGTWQPGCPRSDLSVGKSGAGAYGGEGVSSGS